jgi:hypothetical protein
MYKNFCRRNFSVAVAKKSIPPLDEFDRSFHIVLAFGDEPEVLNAYVKIEGSETRGGFVPEERKAQRRGVY